MRKQILILTAIAALFSSAAYAVPQRVFQDLKLPTQKMIERQAFTNPAAAGSADILSGFAGGTSQSSTSTSTFLAQPDVARNIVVTPGGTTGDIEACNIQVFGTNYGNDPINEVFSFTPDQSSAITGTKAFKTITSAGWYQNCESGSFGATWSIGYGEKLGLKNCMDQAGHIFFSTLNGSKEGTAPTMAVDSDEMEKNTSDFNGTMNGSNDFELFYIQNFRCR